ncbi:MULTISPECIES: hypothetical protein [Bacillus]|uniref:hypothetical protein n=1 Tax=Bacillus TaxID=1386 RepID=UPI000BB8BC61|nr:MULTISPECIES: hypothetical protein [Bacillus]
MTDKKVHRDERFEWQPGDFTITFSQCADCKNNEEIKVCEVYGEKPGVYAMNELKCPSKVVI